jgi:hypothetical protein
MFSERQTGTTGTVLKWLRIKINDKHETSFRQYQAKSYKLLFNILPTVHLGVIIVNNQLDAFF